MPERLRARAHRVAALSSKANMRRLLAAAAAARRAYCVGQRRLAGARRADQQRAGAAIEPAAEQRVELRARRCEATPRSNAVRVLGRDQPREDHDPAAFDDEVVIAAAEVDAAQLRRPAGGGAAPRRAGTSCSSVITPCARLCSCRSRSRAGAVVEQQHGAVAAGEVLLERQDLPAIAQRALRRAGGSRRASRTPRASA